jgi:hypothetical protein
MIVVAISTCVVEIAVLEFTLVLRCARSASISSTKTIAIDATNILLFIQSFSFFLSFFRSLFAVYVHSKVLSTVHDWITFIWNDIYPGKHTKEETHEHEDEEVEEKQKKKEVLTID